MSDFKTLVLCADDFGLNPGVSRAILNLVHLKRLSAVSSMVTMPFFEQAAPALASYRQEVQLGLHFNLTEGFFSSAPHRPCFTLNELLLRTHLHRLNPSFIAQELNAQLDCYFDVMGTHPEFIDGHQHVHQFPIIRDVLLQVYDKRLKKNNTWIRTTYPSVTLKPYRLKGMILTQTGGRALLKQLNQRGIMHHACFSGVYDFAKDCDYGALFRQWLAHIPNNTLMMCHPGEGHYGADPIADARKKELDYFLSDAFLSDCVHHRVRLAHHLQAQSFDSVKV